MSENRAKVIASAIALRGALDALLIELTEDLQEAPTPPQATPLTPSAPAPSCSHEHKRNVRTFGVAEAWDCEDCGYQFRR